MFTGYLMTNEMVKLFSLNTSSGIPIYRQLMDQIKQAIRMGLLKPEDQIPSVRNIASSLQINPMTISKAFAQLEIEGILIRKRGVGMLVGNSNLGFEVSEQVQQVLKQFVTLAKTERFDDEQIMTLVQQYLSINYEE
jgi:GntR family transcriptional regulator